MGSNDPSYNNLDTNQTITVASAGVYSSFIGAFAPGVASSPVPVIAAESVVKLNITTASDATTTETWAVDLFGYLV